MSPDEKDQSPEGAPLEAPVVDEDLESVSGGWPPITTPVSHLPE